VRPNLLRQTLSCPGQHRAHGVREESRKRLRRSGLATPCSSRGLPKRSRRSRTIRRLIIDCPAPARLPPLSALWCGDPLLITVHPQMLDVMSMCQFLIMTSDLLSVVARLVATWTTIGCANLVTRYEPSDGPQSRWSGSSIALRRAHAHQCHAQEHGDFRCRHHQTDALRSQSRQFTAPTYDRAIEALESVNGEIERSHPGAWGRWHGPQNLLVDLIGGELTAVNSSLPEGQMPPEKKSVQPTLGTRGVVGA